MKRFVASLAVAGVCLAVTAGTSAAAEPAPDVVAGDGQGFLPTPFGSFPSEIEVNAIGDPTDAQGQILGRFYTPIGEVQTKADVRCVNADGKQAIVGAVIVESSTSLVPPGSGVLRKFIDNGQGAGDTPDETGTVGVFPPPTSCPDPLATPIPTAPVDQGNYVVQDGG